MNGLKTQDRYRGKLQFEIVSTRTKRGKTEPEKYELGRHGMVILGPDKQVLWKKGGHKMKKKEIVAGIQTSLEKVSGGS